MAKHRRTRKEKLAGDRRTTLPQQPLPTNESSPLFTISQSAVSTPVSRSMPSGTTRLESEHLVADLIKTAILTSAIVIALLLLAFVIKL